MVVTILTGLLAAWLVFGKVRLALCLANLFTPKVERN